MSSVYLHFNNKMSINQNNSLKVQYITIGAQFVWSNNITQVEWCHKYCILPIDY